ncbi:hypothetical protein BB560_005177, partial [Smittium megazygosporum]
MLRYIISLLGAPYRTVVSSSLLLLSRLLLPALDPNESYPESAFVMDTSSSNYPLSRLMCAKLFDEAHFSRSIKLISDLISTCISDDTKKVNSGANHSQNENAHSDSSEKRTEIERKESNQALSVLNSVLKAGKSDGGSYIDKIFNIDEESLEKTRSLPSSYILADLIDCIVGDIEEYPSIRGIPTYLRLNMISSDLSEPQLFQQQSHLDVSGESWLSSSSSRKKVSEFFLQILSCSNTSSTDLTKPGYSIDAKAISKDLTLTVGGILEPFLKFHTFKKFITSPAIFSSLILDIFYTAIPLFELSMFLIDENPSFSQSWSWWLFELYNKDISTSQSNSTLPIEIIQYVYSDGC